MPFLADPKAVQQGDVTEDVMLLGQSLPKPPVSILLADDGYENYASTIFGMKAYLSAHDKAVAAFVAATRTGWQRCIDGDYAPRARRRDRGRPETRRGAVPLQDEAAAGPRDRQERRLPRLRRRCHERRALEAILRQRCPLPGVYPASLDHKAAYTLRYSNAGGPWK